MFEATASQVCARYHEKIVLRLEFMQAGLIKNKPEKVEWDVE